MNTAVWGITPPLSIDTPNASDLAKTAELTAFLKVSNSYEKREEVEHRKHVLSEIYQLATEWIRKKTKDKGRCSLFTAGSYRLGVGGPDADIDALLIVPREVTREQFFNDWSILLKERPTIVSKAIAVPLAFVPIIKCVWRDVDVDLLFANMDNQAITDGLDLASEDDRALEFVHDETSVRSLNGVRVADRILKLVPFVPNFRCALRFIKHWAKKRGIYSNSVGFLGGIAYALLVARVCQLYPNACAFTIVKSFFNVFCKWKWPNPVLLTLPSDAALRLNNGAALSMPQWDPAQNRRDKLHLMPILTPAFPSQNCTFNVGRSTFGIIEKEIQRGADILQEIEKGREAVGGVFALLCEPSTFFHDFTVYLRIDAYVTTATVGEEEKDKEVVCEKKKMEELVAVGITDMDKFMIDGREEEEGGGKQEKERVDEEGGKERKRGISEYERDSWHGFVESRLRFLTASLENTLHVAFVQPFPKGFTEESPDVKTFFFGIKFAPMTLTVGKKTQVDITPAVNDFLERVYAQQPSDAMGCAVSHLNQKTLPLWAK